MTTELPEKLGEKRKKKKKRHQCFITLESSETKEQTKK